MIDLEKIPRRLWKETLATTLARALVLNGAAQVLRGPRA